MGQKNRFASQSGFKIKSPENFPGFLCLIQISSHLPACIGQANCVALKSAGLQLTY
ncbi:MAG: hypothetical protein GXO89_01630 [Chlorobi bacterium]|nr:hypothetical protein [Chlorobiota bacterium]